MSLGLVATICFFWLAIHTSYRILLNRSRNAFLPLPGSAHRSDTFHVPATSFSVTLQSLYLRIESTGLNAPQDRLAAWLVQVKHVLLRRAATRFYDAGALLGVLGFASALSALTFAASATFLSLISSVLKTAPAVSVNAASGLVQRSLEDPNLTQNAPLGNSSGRLITPIIPGLTVPLWHLPILLAALFFNQTIHEAGHAITAAIDSIPVLSVGASLYILIPSAFVKLSSTTALPPVSRLRIIAAGAFHNLLMWLLLTLVISSGIGTTFWILLGYEDVSPYAKVVISIESDSKLREYIPTGALVTQLNDLEFTSTPSSDLWSTYLTINPKPTMPGWCVAQDFYLTRPTSCCSSTHSPSQLSNLSCFMSYEGGRCLDPLTIMVHQPSLDSRCISSSDCDSDAVCVTPAMNEPLLRITFVPKPWGADRMNKTETIVWRGPPSEVYEQVRVGALLPKWFFLPVWLPGLAHMFTEYMATIGLSLYFFNLLPLPYLDGAQLLDALLDYGLAVSNRSSYAQHSYMSREDVELDDIEGGSSGRRRDRDNPTRSPGKERMSRSIRVYTTLMTGSYIALGAMERALR